MIEMTSVLPVHNAVSEPWFDAVNRDVLLHILAVEETIR